MEPITFSQFPSESVKVVGESIGINAVSDDVARELSDETTFRIKTLLQDSMRIMQHSKRSKLNCCDIDGALKVKNIEPLYGIHSREHLPFRFASGGGRELHFMEDKEIEISELVSASPPRFPLQTSIKAHWLAIEGVQPSIPENPPPVAKDLQKKEAVDPASKLSTHTDARDKRHIHGRGMKSTETVKVKQLATHELSAEQQLYYKEITEACVSSDEPKRAEALHSLTYDPGLFQMVPRLCTFIAEGVRVNVVQKNLALLIYLMRMAKSLVDNQSLYLEKYLHEIVPSVMSCIVSKQLCLKPDVDNHWALRDFAARLISQLCKSYNTGTNGLQTRITRVFSRCLVDKTPLSTMYGAIAGLSELGPEVSKVFILPFLRQLGTKIECYVDDPNVFEKTAANSIRNLILKTMPAVIKTTKSSPDSLQEYRNEFGFLGPQLHSAVIKARQTQVAPQHSMSSPAPIKSLASSTRIVQHVPAVSAVGQRTLLVNKPGPAIVQSTSGQKVIIMPSRPQHVSGMASGDSNITMAQTIQSGGQKFVVMSAHNQPAIKQEIKEEPMDIMSPPHSLDIL